MIKGRVSVVIPGCNERYMQATIDSLLSGVHGDVEIFPVIDGGPDNPLREDPRVHPIRHQEQRGMRSVTNDVAQIVTGEFFMKCDAHCIFADGWDAALKADCDDDWVVIPTRHSVEIESWTVKPRNWNYTILTYPYLQSMYGAGIHAVTFDWKLNREINAERAHMPVDDVLACQGSCWFQKTANFLRLGPLDHANYYFYGEAIELCLRTWITGGRCKVNRNTWYAHLHKGASTAHTLDGRQGRGFYLSLDRKRKSEAYGTDFWINDRHPGAQRTFVSLIEEFWPLISRMKDPRYSWPDNWQDFAAHKTWFENRTPDQIPVHL